jgi:CDGSH-type Zn-finger protein
MATKITVKNNGSIRIEGEFELFDINGMKFNLNGRPAISLCRCGHSKDKPFCDGSHREAGFQSEITARELPPLTQKS